MQIKRVFNILFGMLLYVVDSNFRRLVQAKLRGSNEAVAASETVVVVLKPANGG